MNQATGATRRVPSDFPAKAVFRLPSTMAFLARWARWASLPLALATGFVAPAMAAPAGLTLSEAWVRAMPPGQRMTAAYLVIRNDSDRPVSISGVSSPLANASLHETVIEDGVSRMRALPQLTLAPAETMAFVPGGAHIMLMGVRQQPAVGDQVVICLQSSVGELCTDAVVQRSKPATGGSRARD